MKAIGIDIGGTKISGVLISKKRVHKRVKILIKRKSRDEVIKDIISSIRELGNANTIGIGVAGALKNGRILFSANLKCMNGVNIKRIIERKFHIPVTVDNDAHCFAYGESIIRKERNMICITLGTGVGGGIILDGKIYHGMGSAGEFGHMTIMANGRKCKCGNLGCLEEYVGSRGFEYESKKIFGKALSPLEIERMARKENRKAVKIYERIGRYLGIGLTNIINALNPSIIVIGGSIAKSGQLLLKPALREIRKRTIVSSPRILISKRDGAIGAALLAIKKS